MNEKNCVRCSRLQMLICSNSLQRIQKPAKFLKEGIEKPSLITFDKLLLSSMAKTTQHLIKNKQ